MASLVGFNGFSETVSLTCFVSVALGSGGGVYNATPTCTISPTSILSLNGSPSAMTTVAITSTPSSTTCVASLSPATQGSSGSRLMFAAFGLLLLPLGWRKRSSRSWALCSCLLLALTGMCGCGGAGGAGGSGTTNPTPACTTKTVAGTTPGNYTLHLQAATPSGIGYSSDLPITIR